MQRFLFNAALLLAALATAASAQDVTARVTLTPNDVLGLKEPAILEIKISAQGDPGLMPDPVFQLENFRIIGGPTQATSLQFIEGRATASRSLTWQLLPQRLGPARVHAVKISYEGQTFDLPNREVEVVAEPPPGRQNQQAADPFDHLFSKSDDDFEKLFERRRAPRRPADAPRVFLRAEVSPSRPYVGQQVIYTVYIYTQVNIRSVSVDDAPDFKGFWATVIPQENSRLQMVDHEGERYGKDVLMQRGLFARRAGTYEIAPVTFRMLAQMPDSGPLAMPRNKEIMRRSNGLKIQVRDLPDAPEGFTGAVGDLTLKASLEPPALAVGEAATLRLHLSGPGHLSGIPAPLLPEIPGVAVFPPQQQSEESLQGRQIVGSRTWSFVLVPERPGDYEVPAIEIPYFDPRKKRFLVASSPSLPLSASGAPTLAQASGMELHPIRTAVLPVARAWPDLTPYVFVLPWVLGGLVLARRYRRREHLSARRQLLERLDAAESEERPRQAAALIEDAWRDFLHARWDIGEGAASTQWARLLKERGVDAASAEALVKLADDLHYLRYAPKLSAIDELRSDLLERSRKLARAVG